MTSIAATPRLASGAPMLTRSRSNSQVIANANANTTTMMNSLMMAGAPLREGYVMFYDTPTAEWQRIYMTLTMATMSMQSTCSRFGRFVRPTTQLKHVTRFYCSLDVADAPDRHIPILGLRTEKDELFIFRTPERRSLMDWCLHLREACPNAPWETVEDMSVLRSHFSPQLYGTLFRPDLAAKGLVRTPACSTMPQQKHAIPLAARRSSLSAGCPRRGPARRTTGGPSVASQMAIARHADPSAVTTDALPTAEPVAAAFCAQPTALSVVNANTANEPQPRCTSSGSNAMCPDAKKAMIASLKNGCNTRSSVSPSTANNVSPAAATNDENASPAAAAAVKTVSLTTAVPQQSLSAVPAPKPLADPIPTALEKQLQAKVKDLRAELDAVSGRNIDLEIDNANIGARVLELEAEVVTMKDGIAEWRRRYQSLEQQMACQEENYKNKLVDERNSLVANMREEVQSQLGLLKGRFADREKQLEARIAELEAKYEPAAAAAAPEAVSA